MRLVRYFQETCMANSANDNDTAINDDTTMNNNINRAFTLCQAVFKPLLLLLLFLPCGSVGLCGNGPW